jgi:hypothetical protein
MTDIASFQFKDPLSSFNEGYGVANALQRRTTLQTAGNALATGDYPGGAADLYRSGDLQGGLQFDSIAKANAAAAGQGEADQKAQLLKLTQDTATRLSAFHQSQLNAPGADPAAATQRTLAAFDEAAPQFKALGETDDDLAQVRAHIAADPQATFSGLGAAAAKELGYDVKVVNGQIVAIDKGTGKGRIVASAVPTSGGAPPAPAAAPDQQANVDPEAIAPASSGPVDIERFRNAIRQQESNNTAGAVGPVTPYGQAEGVGQVLPTTAEPLARKIGLPWNPAMMRGTTPAALAYQEKISNAAIDEALQASGGDPAAAAAYYFAGPNQALHGPRTAQYVKDVMGRYAGPAPYQVASNGPTPGPPSQPMTQPGAARPDGAIQLAPQQQEWVPDGKGNLVNTKTGDRKIDKTAPPQPVDVDPNEVKMVLEGRYPAPTSGRAATDPKWQALLAAASAQDPQFDAANYATRVKTRQSFLSGPQSQNITALNTVVGHLDALDHSIDHLNNTGGFPGSHFNNMAAHWLATESGTGQRLSDFSANKTAVANELTRVFRGTGGAEADIQAYMKQLDDAKSPDELHQTVRTIANLIHSRLSAVADSYQQGMGLSKDPMEFLHPEQQRAFSRLSGVPIPTPAAQASPAAGATGNPALTKARDAISRGADPAKVKQRLLDAGINPADL